MNKLISLVIIAILISAGISVKAQKFAYIDSQELLTYMPETELAQAKLEKEQAELEAQLEEMTVEYNNLYMSWLENEELMETDENKWSKAIKTVKEEELMSLQERITNFQSTAYQILEERQIELFQPILDKVDTAVEAIAKEKGYVCVFDINNILYINPEKCDDIMNDVKSKLETTTVTESEGN